MLHEIIISGFGGQGVMSMGQLMTYAGMIEDKHVTWLPSYGPEQRGGTANVSVIISDEPVGSPVISYPSAAIVLNKPSFEKFEPLVSSGGVLIVNTSLVDNQSNRTDIKVIEVPASQIATDMGEPRIANTIILGAYLSYSQAISPRAVIDSLKKVLPERRHHLIEINEKALEKGAEFIK